MANTFKFGNGNWAVKEDYALAYNDENGNFKPLPFDFTRASSATRVNKQGLIETVPSGKPRIDFLDNTSGHLLLEPSRTNFLTYSTLDFNGGSIPTGWAVGFGTGTFSHTETTYKGQGAVKHTQSTTGRSYLSETISLSASTTYTLRVEFDRNNSSGIDDTDYIVATANMDNSFAKQWSDVDDDGILEVQFTTGTDATGELRLGFGVSGNEDGGKTIVFSMPQIEAGSYATSYIPTEGSSATRSAETCNQIPRSSIIGQTEGSAYFEYTCNGSDSSGQRIFVLRGSSTADRIAIFDQAGKIRIYVADGGGLQLDTTTNVDTVSTHKVAFRYKLNDFKLYIDGTAIVTDATFTVPTLNSVYVGTSEGFGGTLGGNVSDVKLYDTALSDSDLQALTN